MVKRHSILIWTSPVLMTELLWVHPSLNKPFSCRWPAPMYLGNRTTSLGSLIPGISSWNFLDVMKNVQSSKESPGTGCNLQVSTVKERSSPNDGVSAV